MSCKIEASEVTSLKPGIKKIVSKNNHSEIEKGLREVNNTFHIRYLCNSPSDLMAFYLSKANAIVLEGSEDVLPSLYGQDEYLNICNDTLQHPFIAGVQCHPEG